MQDALNLALKFAYEAPNQIAPNQNMWSHTKVCIDKPCEICDLLRYYAAQSGKSALIIFFFGTLSSA
jgi:hypothetical protein